MAPQDGGSETRLPLVWITKGLAPAKKRTAVGSLAKIARAGPLIIHRNGLTLCDLACATLAASIRQLSATRQQRRTAAGERAPSPSRIARYPQRGTF